MFDNLNKKSINNQLKQDIVKGQVKTEDDLTLIASTHNYILLLLELSLYS